MIISCWSVHQILQVQKIDHFLDIFTVTQVHHIFRHTVSDEMGGLHRCLLTNEHENLVTTVHIHTVDINPIQLLPCKHTTVRHLTEGIEINEEHSVVCGDEHIEDEIHIWKLLFDV